MPRTSTAFAVLGGLLLTTGVTLADPLVLLSRADARRAADTLPPGTRFVDWRSHLPDGTPQLKRVLNVDFAPSGDRPGRPLDRSNATFEVIVRAQLLGTATRRASTSGTRWDWSLAVEPTVTTERIDLASIFVPSRELAFTFVSLGKKLELPCELDTIAIELPAEVLRLAPPALPARRRGVIDLLDPLTGQ